MNGTSRKTATGTRRKMSAAVRVSCFRSRLHRRDALTANQMLLCPLKLHAPRCER